MGFEVKIAKVFNCFSFGVRGGGEEGEGGGEIRVLIIK